MTETVEPTSVESGGQVETGGETEAVADAPGLDINEYGSHVVTIKVDGEEQRIPLSEVTAGYQRQSDYTRKTQELAEQRQQLQWASAIAQALDNDPGQTIQLLQEHYGMSRAEAKQAVQQAVSNSEETWDDPMDARIREMDARLKQFEQDREYQRLEREVVRLQETYGEDFNPQEVVAQAFATGNSNLEAVYKQIAFDRLLQRSRAAEQLAQTIANQEAAVIEAKRNAGNVSGGVTASGVGEIDASPIRTISDAWNAAKRSYGIS